jgi:hypothetical protein
MNGVKELPKRAEVQRSSVSGLSFLKQLRGFAIFAVNASTSIFLVRAIEAGLIAVGGRMR